MISHICRIILTFSLGVSFLLADEATLRNEFQEIAKRREQRTMLVDYLKNSKIAAESADGTLAGSAAADSKAKSMITQENADRLRLFEIIAELEGGTAESIGQAFAEKMGVVVNQRPASIAPNNTAPQVITVLRIHGSNTVGAELAPELVRGFLEKQGFKDIATRKDGVETFITFRRPGEANLAQVEIKAHGSSTAFAETDDNKSVGLANGFADLGMASRQIKPEEAQVLSAQGFGNMSSAACEYPIALDGVAIITNTNNGIKLLTVTEIAAIFSGQINNWKEVGGSDQPIEIFARDDQSGTWDTFESKVLKPADATLSNSAKRFEDSDLLVRNVASTPGSIGFVGLPNVNSTVQDIAVQAGVGTRALQATRLTVKAMDYPLARLLYFYLPLNSTTMARDFVKFTMNDDGQAIVDGVGLVGQGRASNIDRRNADQLKQTLLADAAAPSEYKELVAKSDRRDTQANIRFATGELEPDINSLNNLGRLSSFLAEPENADATVLLIGFADSYGTEGANRELSLKRAEAVAEILRAKGVTNLQVHGFGEAMPVADNSSSEGRSQNRRVEIWLQR